MKKFFTRWVKKFFTGQRLIVLLWAFVFTLLSEWVQYYPWIGPEQKIITESSSLRKWIWHNSAKEDLATLSQNFLLINLTNDADVYRDPRPGMQLCEDSVNGKVLPSLPTVDRQRLGLLFKWLLEHPDRYDQIVCDVLFADRDPSQQNTLLWEYMKMLQEDEKIIFAGEYDKNGKSFSRGQFSKVEDDGNTGTVNEDRTDGLFFTYRLSYDDAAVSSLPLLMYQRINHYPVTRNRWGYLRCEDSAGRGVTGKNVFIPEMIFDTADINKLKTLNGNVTPDTSIAMLDLWQTLQSCQGIPNFYLRQALDSPGTVKRNIFIGSFTHDHADVHKTLYGDLDGSVILLNIYFNILKRQNRIDMRYLLLLLVCFYGIFYRLLIHPHSPYHGKRRLLRYFFTYLFEELHYFILVAMTIAANVFFGKVTNVLILASLFFFIDKALILWRDHRQSKMASAMTRAHGGR